MQYRVTKRIQHNGAWYEPGDTLEEDERSSEALIDAGAIELVDLEPSKADKGKATKRAETEPAR